MQRLHSDAYVGGAVNRRAYPSIEQAWQRLAEFLGDGFDARLTDPKNFETLVESEFDKYGQKFYTLGTGYLYELTHFHYTSHKDAFFQMVRGAVRRFGLSDVADVGCGVGLDAQALCETGARLALYDFPSISREYAAWRIARDSGGHFCVSDLDDLGKVRHSMVYAVDVLEHCAAPFEFLDRLFEVGQWVCFNIFPHDGERWDGKDMHFPQDHNSLLPFCSQRGELYQVAGTGDTVAMLWRSR
jgi:hypothetical protein